MAASKRYRVLVGLNYPGKKGEPEIRREPGEIANDIPDDSVDWLLEQKCIEPMKADRKPKKSDEKDDEGES